METLWLNRQKTDGNHHKVEQAITGNQTQSEQYSNLLHVETTQDKSYTYVHIFNTEAYPTYIVPDKQFK